LLPSIGIPKDSLIPLEDCFNQLKKILKLPDDNIKALIRTMQDKGLIVLKIGVRKKEKSRGDVDSTAKFPTKGMRVQSRGGVGK